MRSRRDLFGADPMLTMRMLVAAVVTPAVVVAALAVVVLWAPWQLKAGVLLASVMGVSAVMAERRERIRGSAVSPATAPELHAIVERLCLLADLPKPEIVVEPEAQPNSWVLSTGRHRTRLHLTRGLLERLEPVQLEAVIAHELAHVAHRDAAVMTLVGGPAAALLGGGSKLVRGGSIWFITVGGIAAIAIGWLSSVGSRALSRYREFAADAGAVALTGNPAALASALMAVSDGLASTPARDLRAAAARDAFHLLPVAPRRRRRGDRIPPLPPTHPPLKARIARLEKLEARLQSAR